MNITVKQEVLDLIKTLEAQEVEAFTKEFGDVTVPLSFAWSYGEDGNYASGESWAWRPHARYNVAVYKNSVEVQRDQLDKWSNDGWCLHPLSTDYEADEEEAE